MNKLLIVDDDELIQEVYKTALNSYFPDLVIETTKSLKGLRESLTKEIPEILFLDCQVQDGMVYTEIGPLMKEFPEIEDKLKIFVSGTLYVEKIVEYQDGILPLKNSYFFNKPLQVSLAMDLIGEYLMLKRIKRDK